MSCKSVQRRFSKHLDGRLSGAEKIDGHLEECPTCRLQLEGMSQLQARMSQLPAPVVPAGLAARLATYALTTQARVERLLFFNRVALPAVAMGLALAISLVLFGPEQNTQQMTSDSPTLDLVEMTAGYSELAASRFSILGDEE